MAIIKAVSGGALYISDIINYVTKKEKDAVIKGINCNAESAFDEMLATKLLYNKLDGRQYKHFTLSFAPDDNITAEQCNDIAEEIIKHCPMFAGFEILLTAHQDKDHQHTHIIVNSVSMENGKKFRYSKADLAEMKKICNQICRERGLIVAEKGKQADGTERTAPTSWNKYEYKTLIQADEHITALQEQGRNLEPTDSWKYNIALSIEMARAEAESMEQFMQLLDADDIDVEPDGKYITFIDRPRKASGEKKYKIRDKTLSKNFNIIINKEVLENGFKVNKQRQSQSTSRTAGQLATAIRNSNTAITAERQYNSVSADTIRKIDADSTTARKIADRENRRNQLVEQRSREADAVSRESETARSNEQRTIEQNQRIRTTIADREKAKRYFASKYYGNR